MVVLRETEQGHEVAGQTDPRGATNKPQRMIVRLGQIEQEEGEEEPTLGIRKDLDPAECLKALYRLINP